jgi:hypothetical protein
MPTYKELTEEQREPLFKLVRYQKNLKKETRFTYDWRGDANVGQYILDSENNRIIVDHFTQEYFLIWEQNGFITPQGKFSISHWEMRFILRKEAIDYEDYFSKSKFQRFFITLGEKLFEDISSLVWPVVVSIITTIIVYFILRGIGAKP